MNAVLALPRLRPRTFVASAAVLWFAAYLALAPLADALVTALPVEPSSRLGETIRFFLYDTPKVLLLTGVVMVMGMINSYFTPERTRVMLAGRAEGVGNVMAALLGITFSFLVSAPMVNEVALTLLFGLFGCKVAALYLGLGLSIAIVSGWVIGRARMEAYLEDWVQQMPKAHATVGEDSLTLADRIQAGFASVREIVGRVWPYVIVGLGVGAAIHGYVPEAFMARLMGRDAWWSVPLSVLIGVPMYANAAGIIPIVEALLSKGAALGTVLAFMMSVIALSLPEMIILRKVLKPQLIATFVAVVASGILIVGYVFNAVL